MRGVVRCVLAAIVTAAECGCGPSRLQHRRRASRIDPTIASVLPAQGAVVGVAHPVVVTFRAPVADRRAAERALDIKSVPAMTGKFEWLENNVVQWVPDRFWPAHSTVSLSVRGSLATTNFQNGARRRRRCQYLGPHVHRDHRRRRRGTAASNCRRRTTGPTGANRACSRPRWVGRSIRRQSARLPFWPRNATW